MPIPNSPLAEQRIDALRAFNRFYTRRIGVLHERLAGSRFTLTESRLLWELAHHEGGLTAAALARELELDPGYLSRTLRSLREAGLLRATRSSSDARQSLLTLTPAGRRAFRPLEDHTRRDMAGLLAPLSEAQQQRLLGALSTVGALLDPVAPRDLPDDVPNAAPEPPHDLPNDRQNDRPNAAPDAAPKHLPPDLPTEASTGLQVDVPLEVPQPRPHPYPHPHPHPHPLPHPQPPRLRPIEPGDIGWMIGRHGAVYARDYGWTIAFEALVARIGADFIDRFDAAREAGWVAERDGERLGCVFLVQSRDDATQQPEPGTAQLRLLLVEAEARGLGLGRQLVAQCTAFAREAGYQRIRLWTQSMLTAARTLYAREGYRLTGTEPHHSFGHDLVGEIWELELAPPQANS